MKYEEFNKAPNLIIPGFPKSGTSSLFEYLIQHPLIFGSVKEPHIYSIDERYNKRFNKSCEFTFENIFSKAHERAYRLEASTTYMISKKAPERIYEDSPQCLFIIIARDPIERIMSHYKWLKSKGLVKHPFKEEISCWINKSFDPKVRYRGNFKNYLEFSMYGLQIMRYLKFFNRSQFFFTTLEEMNLDPLGTINNILNFLNLTQFSKDNLNTSIRNETILDFDQFSKIIRKVNRRLPISAQRIIKKYIYKPIYRNKLKELRLSYEDKIWLYNLLKKDLDVLDNLGLKSNYWKTIAEIEQQY